MNQGVPLGTEHSVQHNHMSLFTHLSLGELSQMLQVVQQSLAIRSHYSLFNWLQDDTQFFIPHDLVIAAWGDFSLGLVCYDVVSPLPGLRTDNFDDKSLQPFVTHLFKRWDACEQAPFTLHSSEGFQLQGIQNQDALNTLSSMRTTLVHGIKDQRGRHDCLYIFMGPVSLGGEKPREALRYLLPYLDVAFRQVAHLPEQYLNDTILAANLAPPPKTDAEVGLSAREVDIMEWVRKGKTNHEIGMILDISAFTVKNHVQRIFKKLDVVNRAQAVAKIETMRNSAR